MMMNASAEVGLKDVAAILREAVRIAQSLDAIGADYPALQDFEPDEGFRKRVAEFRRKGRYVASRLTKCFHLLAEGLDSDPATASVELREGREMLTALRCETHDILWDYHSFYCEYEMEYLFVACELERCRRHLGELPANHI